MGAGAEVAADAIGVTFGGDDPACVEPDAQASGAATRPASATLAATLRRCAAGRRVGTWRTYLRAGNRTDL